MNYRSLPSYRWSWSFDYYDISEGLFKILHRSRLQSNPDRSQGSHPQESSRKQSFSGPDTRQWSDGYDPVVSRVCWVATEGAEQAEGVNWWSAELLNCQSNPTTVFNFRYWWFYRNYWSEKVIGIETIAAAGRPLFCLESIWIRIYHIF